MFSSIFCHCSIGPSGLPSKLCLPGGHISLFSLTSPSSFVSEWSILHWLLLVCTKPFCYFFLFQTVYWLLGWGGLCGWAWGWDPGRREWSGQEDFPSGCSRMMFQQHSYISIIRKGTGLKENKFIALILSFFLSFHIAKPWLSHCDLDCSIIFSIRHFSVLLWRGKDETTYLEFKNK